MLYLLKQLSFSKNVFTFGSITSRSFKIIYLWAQRGSMLFRLAFITLVSCNKSIYPIQPSFYLLPATGNDAIVICNI